MRRTFLTSHLWANSRILSSGHWYITDIQMLYLPTQPKRGVPKQYLLLSQVKYGMNEQTLAVVFEKFPEQVHQDFYLVFVSIRQSNKVLTKNL